MKIFNCVIVYNFFLAGWNSTQVRADYRCGAFIARERLSWSSENGKMNNRLYLRLCNHCVFFVSGLRTKRKQERRDERQKGNTANAHSLVSANRQRISEFNNGSGEDQRHATRWLRNGAAFLCTNTTAAAGRTCDLP